MTKAMVLAMSILALPQLTGQEQANTRGHYKYSITLCRTKNDAPFIKACIQFKNLGEDLVMEVKMLLQVYNKFIEDGTCIP